MSFKATDIIEAVENELKKENATFESIKDAVEALDEEVKEETVEETVEDEVKEESVEEEAKEETVEEAEIPAETINLTEVLEKIEELKAEIERLKAENESLKVTLSTKEQEEREFVERFKGLTVSLAERKTVETPKETVDYTNGIGEF